VISQFKQQSSEMKTQKTSLKLANIVYCDLNVFRAAEGQVIVRICISWSVVGPRLDLIISRDWLAVTRGTRMEQLGSKKS
jgi:hypothetical protein